MHSYLLTTQASERESLIALGSHQKGTLISAFAISHCVVQSLKDRCSYSVRKKIERQIRKHVNYLPWIHGNVKKKKKYWYIHDLVDVQQNQI